MARKKLTDFIRYKQEGRAICAVTATSFAEAVIAGRTDMDIILVGDSLGMVALGYEDTTRVTMDEMVHHARAVGHARPDAVLIADLPFLSYHAGLASTMKNVRRLLQETGMDAVKVEGGSEIAPLVRKLCDGGVSVMGHIGLMPQSVKKAGAYRIRGKTGDDTKTLVKDALALEKAGASAIVLEGMKPEAAAEITRSLSIPTIGIGAGPDCDGQILVINDMLGLTPDFHPRFVRRYAEIAGSALKGLKDYADDVRGRRFPSDEESYE